MQNSHGLVISFHLPTLLHSSNDVAEALWTMIPFFMTTIHAKREHHTNKQYIGLAHIYILKKQ
jgi:hypothetical protein